MRWPAMCPGKTAGESPAPVKRARESRGKPVLKPVVFEPSPLLLNWRELMRATTLSGLPRQVAAGAEVLELTENHVLLRPEVGRLLDECRSQIEEAIGEVKGHAFSVNRTAEDKRDENAPCVQLLEQSEKRAARLAMIDAFKSDPIVQECVRILCAEIDETSIRPLTENEVRETVIYERQHPGSARSGSKNAKKR